MGEFEEKLNSILGDKEAMGQIMALAQSLGKPAPPAPKPEEETREPGWERTGAPAPESGAGEDPLSMLGSLDPRMVQMGMRLLKEYRTGDDRERRPAGCPAPIPAEGAVRQAGPGHPDRQAVPGAPGGLPVSGREGGGRGCITVISQTGRFIPASPWRRRKQRPGSVRLRAPPLRTDPERAPGGLPFSIASLLGSGAGKGGGLTGLLRSLKLDRLDSGDILLLLIVLLLLWEGDDLELVIALGLALIMGLGDEEEAEME